MISDLLKPERTNLGIREDRKRGIYVDGLSEWVVRTPQEVRPSPPPSDAPLPTFGSTPHRSDPIIWARPAMPDHAQRMA